MGAEQTPLLQAPPLTQSVGWLHFFPTAHEGQSPPQSTSVSLPPHRPSVQEPVRQLPPVQIPAGQVLRIDVAPTPADTRHTVLTQSADAVHALPSAHLTEHCGPPQSTSVSPPFVTESGGEHFGAWQNPPLHTPLAQSAALPQAFVSAHFGHPVPPQSISVSVPFLTPSAGVQLDGWHVLLAEQTPLAQSDPMPQIFPSVQRAQKGPPQSVSDSFVVSLMRLLHVSMRHLLPSHLPLPAQSSLTPQVWPAMHSFGAARQVAPPQSISVSRPFLRPSVQDASLHVPPMQKPVAQSVSMVHALPSEHRAEHAAPPQSTSVSPWFLTPSGQVGAWHAFGAPVQTPLVQSLLAAQLLLAAHAGHPSPPQSRSVSVPFLTRSAGTQVGTAQRPLVHTPLAQSVPASHILPSAHGEQPGPPQSRSVSAPFWT